MSQSPGGRYPPRVPKAPEAFSTTIEKNWSGSLPLSFFLAISTRLC